MDREEHQIILYGWRGLSGMDCQHPQEIEAGGVSGSEGEEMMKIFDNDDPAENIDRPNIRYEVAGTDFNWSEHTCVKTLNLNALPSSVGMEFSFFLIFDRKIDIPKYLRKVMMLTYKPWGKLSIWFEVLKHQNI